MVIGVVVHIFFFSSWFKEEEEEEMCSWLLFEWTFHVNIKDGSRRDAVFSLLLYSRWKCFFFRFSTWTSDTDDAESSRKTSSSFIIRRMVAMTHALMWLASSLVLKSSKGNYVFFYHLDRLSYNEYMCAMRPGFSLAASAGVFLHHPLLASLSGVERLTNGKQQQHALRERHTNGWTKHAKKKKKKTEIKK